MEKYISVTKVLSVFFMLFLIGCNANSNTYHKITSKIDEEKTKKNSISSTENEIDHSSISASQTPKEILQGHLTIKTFWDEDIGIYIQDFISLHPNVTIDLIQPGKDDFFSFDDYQMQTAVELMSGKSADIIDVAGLAVFKYAKSGAFCDLYSFMDSDPDFNKDDYYTNIFEGKEFNGSLYSMPCGFTYDMLYGSKNLLEAANLQLPITINYKEMFSIYEEVLASTEESPKLMPGLDPYTFFYYEYPEYYDINTRTASFNTPDFIEYLKTTKDRIPLNDENDFTRIGYDDSFLYKDYLFCKFDISGGTDLFNFIYDFQNITEPIPIVSTSGNTYFRTMREYAIANSSTNKELAWEFIKYYISEKELPNTLESEYAEKYYSVYNAFVPINKENFFHGFKFSCNYALKYVNADFSVPLKDDEIDQLIGQSLKLIDQWNQSRTTEQAEGEIYGLLCDELNNYYYFDLLTAEEVAAKLQNKMKIFLQE